MFTFMQRKAGQSEFSINQRYKYADALPLQTALISLANKRLTAHKSELREASFRFARKKNANRNLKEPNSLAAIT